MRILGVVLLVAACGDPRAVFVGTYEGVSQFTLSTSSGPQTFNDPTEVIVTAPPQSNRLSIERFGCTFSATIEDSTELQIDPISCPSRREQSTGGVLADFTLTFNRGSASADNLTLVITQTGTELGSNYADGTPNQIYDINTSCTVTKQ